MCRHDTGVGILSSPLYFTLPSSVFEVVHFKKEWGFVSSKEVFQGAPVLTGVAFLAHCDVVHESMILCFALIRHLDSNHALFQTVTATSGVCCTASSKR